MNLGVKVCDEKVSQGVESRCKKAFASFQTNGFQSSSPSHLSLPSLLHLSLSSLLHLSLSSLLHLSLSSLLHLSLSSLLHLSLSSLLHLSLFLITLMRRTLRLCFEYCHGKKQLKKENDGTSGYQVMYIHCEFISSNVGGREAKKERGRKEEKKKWLEVIREAGGNFRWK